MTKLEERFRVKEDRIGNELLRTIHLLGRDEKVEHRLDDGNETYIGRIVDPRIFCDNDSCSLFGRAQIEKYTPASSSIEELFFGKKIRRYNVTTKDLFEPFTLAGLTGQKEYEWSLHRQASEESIVLPGQIVRKLFEPVIQENVQKLCLEYKSLENPDFIKRVNRRQYDMHQFYG